MKYPKEVQAKIDILNTYKENTELKTFNILQLYSKELAYPNGYYDSRFFDLIVFNTVKMEKCNLGRHDAIDFKNCIIAYSSIFADGAFLIRTANMITIDIDSQKIYMINTL